MARSRKFPKKLGIITGRGTPTSDNIPATLPRNGYVLPADTVAFVHGGRCYANGGVVDERFLGMQPSIAQFANGGFLGLLFGESNADRNRREIREMNEGTYKGQQGAQSTNIDNQPTQLNNKGINVIKNRTDQINDTVDRAVNGYKDGGIPAMVSPGEAVLSPKSIADFGRAVLDLVRASTHEKVQHYAEGGIIEPFDQSKTIKSIIEPIEGPKYSPPSPPPTPEPFEGPKLGKAPTSIGAFGKIVGRGLNAASLMWPNQAGETNDLATPEAQKSFTDPNSSANYYRQQSVLNRRGRTRNDINNSVIGNYLASNQIDNAISNYMFDTSLPTGSQPTTSNAPTVGGKDSTKIPVGGVSDIVQNPFNVSRGTIDPNQSYIGDKGIGQPGPGGQYKIDANGNVTKFDANGNQVKMRGGFGIMDSPKSSDSTGGQAISDELQLSPEQIHLSNLREDSNSLRYKINHMLETFPDTSENRKKIAFYANQLKGIEDELGQNNRANLAANAAIQSRTIDAFGRQQSALARLQAEQARQSIAQKLAMPKYASDLLDLKYKQDLSSPDQSVRDQAEAYFKRAKGEQQPQIFDVQIDPEDFTKTAKARYNNGRLEILPIAGQNNQQQPLSNQAAQPKLNLTVGKKYQGDDGSFAVYQGTDKNGNAIWIGENGKRL